jgi:hypothetical protein
VFRSANIGGPDAPMFGFPGAGSVFTSLFAQQRDKSSGEITQPHHLVVPLTSKGLSGIVSGDPTKAGALGATGCLDASKLDGMTPE